MKEKDDIPQGRTAFDAFQHIDTVSPRSVLLIAGSLADKDISAKTPATEATSPKNSLLLTACRSVRCAEFCRTGRQQADGILWQELEKYAGNTMKKSIILLNFAMLCFGLSDVCMAAETQAKKIKMLFSGEQAVVVLDAHPAVQDLLSMLPMTVTFEDYNGMEKIGYLQRKLQTEGSPSSCDPSVGTFAYYAPWGNLSVFYRDFRHSEGLVPLGRIESGMNSLARMQGDFSVRLEVCE